MPEPISSTAFGFKPAVLLASFIGAVISLQFLKDIGPKQGIFTVLTGLGLAVYLEPFVSARVPFVDTIDPAQVQNGTAFIIGLLGMNIVAWLMTLDIGKIINRGGQ